MTNNDPSAPHQQQQTLNIKLISNQPPSLNAANMPDSGPGPEKSTESKTDAKEGDRITKDTNEEKDKARKHASLGENIYP